MPAASELQRVAVQINELLTEYIGIENKMFSNSIWRSLPIPFLFKPIPFGALGKRAVDIASQLRIHKDYLTSLLGSTSGELREFHVCLADYSGRLADAADQLGMLGSKLANKSNGVPYSLADYEHDTQSYDVYRKGYLALGERLNRLYVSISHR